MKITKKYITHISSKDDEHSCTCTKVGGRILLVARLQNAKSIATLCKMYGRTYKSIVSLYLSLLTTAITINKENFLFKTIYPFFLPIIESGV
jgi:hypothetical protein